MKNLAAAFLDSASRHPGKPALFHGQEELTFQQLVDQSAWITRELVRSYEVRPGDRVGIWLRNCPEFVSAFMGILRAGAVVVPINNFLKSAELSYMLADADIQVLISEAALADNFADLSKSHPQLRILRIEELPLTPSHDEDRDVGESGRNPEDLAVLIYTSGTTGKPKGAMLTHANLLHNVESCRQILQVVEIDRFVLLLPMFHSFMLTVCILLPLLTGGSIVLIKSLNSPKHMVAEILQRQGTVLPAMAQVFRALSQLPDGVDLSCLRLCISGAGPLPMEILKGFNQRFPNVPLIEGYGLSEASPVVSVNPVKGPWIPGTIGIPIPDVEVAIQEDSGEIVEDEKVGELCVRGGNVMKGYWNAPEKTAETLVGGWLRTGDIGYRRSDGYFVITDRKKDMLKPNGINVYPREIEEIIYQFPGVRECAVVGEPDERRGERPVAFVSLDDSHPFDEKSLMTFLKERLADYKLPKRAVVVAALPRNATGKILKTVLREQIAAGVA